MADLPRTLSAMVHDAPASTRCLNEIPALGPAMPPPSHDRPPLPSSTTRRRPFSFHAGDAVAAFRAFYPNLQAILGEAAESVAAYARRQGVDAQQLLVELAFAADPVPLGTSEDEDLGALSLGELADHIEHQHHRFLRAELGRLGVLIEALASAPEASQDEGAIRAGFVGLRRHLLEHMQVEERDMFPLAHHLDAHPDDEELDLSDFDHAAVIQFHDHDDGREQMQRIMAAVASLAGSGAALHERIQAGLAILIDDLEWHFEKEESYLVPAMADHIHSHECSRQVRTQSPPPSAP